MKRGLILVILFSLFIELSFISANIMHSGADINIIIDGASSNLNSGASYFIGTHSYSSSSVLMGQHNSSEIWVSVQDGEMTLLNALQSTNKLCPNPTKPTAYSSSNIPNPSHLATEIQLNSGKTFQTAINDGDFCGIQQQCIPGTSKSSTCENTICATYGIATLVCQSSGTWPNPICPIVGYRARGTSCATDKTCDGGGNCVGYSGNDCDSCPFGTQDIGSSTFCKLTYNGFCYEGKWYTANYQWTSWKDHNSQSLPMSGAVCGDTVCNILGKSCETTDFSWKMVPIASCPSSTSTTGSGQGSPSSTSTSDGSTTTSGGSSNDVGAGAPGAGSSSSGGSSNDVGASGGTPGGTFNR